MAVALTIGEFSRITHLSIRALRRYHEAGILDPAHIDCQTGYRYYTLDQVPTAQVIHRFRELGMPVREVGELVAITDPGSHLESVAKEHGFRAVLPGVPSIGGRYSALSNFGVAPAAVMGVDVQKFLASTLEMVKACAGSVPASKNPGGILGAVLGTLGKGGRNKVTLITSPGIGDLGAWLEQLLADSTGKQGKGLIPAPGQSPDRPDRQSHEVRLPDPY
jgi:DNA-binding transcriptional MerR regulator